MMAPDGMGIGNRSEPNRVNVNLSLKDLGEVICENCEGDIFQEGVMIRSVSPLLTGNGREGIYPIPVFFCVKCHEPLEQYLPQELRRKVASAIIPQS